VNSTNTHRPFFLRFSFFFTEFFSLSIVYWYFVSRQKTIVMYIMKMNLMISREFLFFRFFIFREKIIEIEKSSERIDFEK